ncbi:MAG: hypothetical protein WCD18_22015 [Thermosynechococcaceae cyanobacterium]
MSRYFDYGRLSDNRMLLRELVASLRFHQRQWLQEMPRDLVLQAMHEAWEASQRDAMPMSGQAPEPIHVSCLYVSRTRH